MGRRLPLRLLLFPAVAGLAAGGAAFVLSPAEQPATTPAAVVLGTATLGNDGAGALFAGSTLTPGTTLRRCLQISYDGPAATGAVRLLADNVTGTLASYLSVDVEVGTGGAYGSCTGFSGMPVFSGPFAGLTAPDAAAPGVGTGWTPAGAETRTFRITVAVADDNAAQARTGTADLRWVLMPDAIGTAPPTTPPTTPAATPTTDPTTAPTSAPATTPPTSAPPTSAPATSAPATTRPPATPTARPTATPSTPPAGTPPVSPTPAITAPPAGSASPDPAETATAEPTPADTPAAEPTPVGSLTGTPTAAGPATAPASAGASSAPATAGTGTPAAPGGAPAPPRGHGAPPDSALDRTLQRTGRLIVLLGRHAAFPLLAVLLMVLFLLVQDRIDRKDPKLALAPLVPDQFAHFSPSGDPSGTPLGNPSGNPSGGPKEDTR